MSSPVDRERIEAIRNRNRNARLDWKLETDEPCLLLDDIAYLLDLLASQAATPAQGDVVVCNCGHPNCPSKHGITLHSRDIHMPICKAWRYPGIGVCDCIIGKLRATLTAAQGRMTQVAQIACHLRTKAAAADGIAQRTEPWVGRNWAGLAVELNDSAWSLEELVAGRDVAALIQGAKNREAALTASPAATKE